MNNRFVSVYSIRSQPLRQLCMVSNAKIIVYVYGVYACLCVCVCVCARDEQWVKTHWIKRCVWLKAKQLSYSSLCCSYFLVRFYFRASPRLMCVCMCVFVWECVHDGLVCLIRIMFHRKRCLNWFSYTRTYTQTRETERRGGATCICHQNTVRIGPTYLNFYTQKQYSDVKYTSFAHNHSIHVV